VASVVACGSGDSDNAGDSAASTATISAGNTVSDAAGGVTESRGPITFSSADLDGFEKGLAREIELVRAAAERASRATTPQERGQAIQAGFEQTTMAEAAPVTGLSAERYRLVRETITTLLTTLDFQGKIDGPQSMDTSRADAAMKARLASDPYSVLDPGSAAALRSRMDRIVPLWVQYVNLTAVAG